MNNLSIFPFAEWLHTTFSVETLEIFYYASVSFTYVLAFSIVSSIVVMTYRNIRAIRYDREWAKSVNADIKPEKLYSTMDFVMLYLKFAVLFAINAILNQSLIETIWYM